MYNYTIIGAGIVGLATAYQILQKQPGARLLILEKESDVSKHQTGNNSGVIHSGIYYKPGGLKALNCSKGYKLLLDFCDQNEIKYNLCGKVIVAIDEREVNYLDTLYERGIQNGLMGIRKLTADELKEIEPHANGIAALHVPQTGIIDFKEVSVKLRDLIIQNGGEFKFNEEVVSIKKSNGGIEIITESSNYKTENLISCAGLYSDRITKMTNKEIPLRIIPFRGEYYKLRADKNYLVNTLIYPVPDPAFPFLGVHFTNMIDGGVEAGPNAVFAFKREGYSKFAFNFRDTFESLSWRGFHKVMFKYWKTGLGEYYRSFSKMAFVKALRKLIPEIEASDLVVGGSGVRAQACDIKGGLLDDFFIFEEKNIFHVCNAPSPAATSSLAIGDYIANKVLEHNS
ncbi:MAG: L-2-hydroxyglutarate oxidase [Bacteroidota bacterium]